jgi:hypothetical protein
VSNFSLDKADDFIDGQQCVESQIQGVHFQGTPELSQSFFVPSKKGQKQAIPLICIAIFGVQFQGPAERPLRRVPFPQILIGASQHCMGFGQSVVDGQRFLCRSACFGAVSTADTGA